MKQTLSKELLQTIRSFNDIVKVSDKLRAQIHKHGSKVRASNVPCAAEASSIVIDGDSIHVVDTVPTKHRSAIDTNVGAIGAINTHIDTLKALKIMAEAYSDMRAYQGFVRGVTSLMAEAASFVEQARSNINVVTEATCPVPFKALSNTVQGHLAVIVPESQYRNLRVHGYVSTDPLERPVCGESVSYVYQTCFEYTDFKATRGVNDACAHAYPDLSIVLTARVDPIEANGKPVHLASYYVNIVPGRTDPGTFDPGVRVSSLARATSTVDTLLSRYNGTLLAKDGRERMPMRGKKAELLRSLASQRDIEGVLVQPDHVRVVCAASVGRDGDRREDLFNAIVSVSRSIFGDDANVKHDGGVMEKMDGKNKFVVEFHVAKACAADPAITRNTLLMLKQHLGLDVDQLQKLKNVLIKNDG